MTCDFKEVFCCHAGYVKNGRAAPQKKLDDLLNLQGMFLDLYEKGAAPKEIQARLFPRKYPIARISSGEWNSIQIGNSRIREEKKDHLIVASSKRQRRLAEDENRERKPGFQPMPRAEASIL